jgi:hypothetical protein
VLNDAARAALTSGRLARGLPGRETVRASERADEASSGRGTKGWAQGWK